jgi:hypothetical protein
MDTEILYSVMKRPRREANSPPSNAKVKNV